MWEAFLELFQIGHLGLLMDLENIATRTNKAVEAAHISWGEEECFAYFNGDWGHFEGAHKFANVRVLSSYLNLRSPEPQSI